MSEEEALKQLKEACITDPLCCEVDGLTEKDLEAIRTILDENDKLKQANEVLRKIVKNLEKEKVNNFLKELTTLSEKYNLEIGGCGCCGSPTIESIKIEEVGGSYIHEEGLTYIDNQGYQTY